MSQPIHSQPDQPNVTVLAPGTNTPNRIGRMLVELGKISREDVERVVQVQQETGSRFGAAARSLHLVSEADIQQALARQFGYPYLQPGETFCSPELVVAYDPFGEAAEVFRTIRSQLMLRWFRHGRCELVVLAGSSAEDASMFTANLAIAFSQLGKSTLLVDADLRGGRHAELFGLAPEYGLAEILAGRASTDAIATTKPFPDLSILTAGTLPPNPVELLGRPTLDSLRADLRRRFEIILYNVPPFPHANEVLTLAVEAGGALVLAKRNSARASETAAIARQLTENGVTVVGSVLT